MHMSAQQGFDLAVLFYIAVCGLCINKTAFGT